MHITKCELTTWSGREALRLSAAGYEALLVPSLGANVVELHTTLGGRPLDMLRTPLDAQTLLDDPYAYGIPVLFPANRVAGGCYHWDGIAYTFPRNYPNDVHIHGVLHNRAWPVFEYGAREEKAWATLRLDTDTDTALRAHFPIPMAIQLEVILDAQGLHHVFTVENNSDVEIPVGLAYHTAFRVDFSGNPQGVRMHVPLQGRCADDLVDRLPNGETEPLDDFETRIASQEGAYPLEKMVDTLYTAQPGTNKTVFRDAANRCEMVYEVGPENHYWILWNKTATEGFIAVEPQTWLSDAMHRPSPAAHGAAFVPPGRCWSSACRIFARPMED